MLSPLCPSAFAQATANRFVTYVSALTLERKREDAEIFFYEKILSAHNRWFTVAQRGIAAACSCA